MAKITRIKAKDSPKEEKADEPKITRERVVIKDKKEQKIAKKEKRKAEKEIAKEKPKKKVFILFRPFVAFFRYLKDSWHELRQVRWPNRKTTWKMVFAVLVYTALFAVIISLLDLFFSWLFNLILG